MADPTPARLRHCPTHGQQPPEAWGCPECLRELREELAECREALRRVRRWGSTFGSAYSSAVAMGVMDWIDAGMTGPLPAMPEYLEGRPNG